jgi:signal transduction histidine kinase
MKNKLAILLIFLFGLNLIVGCSTSTEQYAAGKRSVKASAGWSTGSRENARAEANKICSANGGGIKFEGEGPCGFTCEVYFRCFDYGAMIADKQREEAAKKREEAANKAKELQKQQLEEQRRRAEAAEYERTRPQREAAYKAAQDKERTRLALMCPVYYFARQSCASAPNYTSCMTIRLGNSYSSWDDRTCYNR